MSVGGKVIESIVFDDVVYINTHDGSCECAIYVERDQHSEKVTVDDIVWWQGGNAYWTTADRKTVVEKVLKRRGYSGVPHPHDRPRVKVSESERLDIQGFLRRETQDR